MGVAHEGGQVGLVGHLAAERDGEAQGGAGRLAEPGGEQGGGGGALGEGGQRYVVASSASKGASTGGSSGASWKYAELVEGVSARPAAGRAAAAGHRPARSAAGSPSDSNQRSPAQFDSSSVRTRPTDALQELEAAAAVEAAEEDLFEERVGGRRGDVGGRGDHEGALGGGVEELVERGAADLHVVEDDDRADLVDEAEQFVAVRAVQGSVVDGGEEVVQQVGRGAPVTGEADDAVGGEVRAVVGDGVEQDRAAGAGGAGEPYGTAAREEAYEPLALVLALQERQPGLRGARRHAAAWRRGPARRVRRRRA